jgi:hypothetical protein
MEKTFINQVTKGDYVKRKESSKKTYKLNGWCRINKRYELQDVEDINHVFYVKSYTPVYVGFTY